MSSGLRQAAEVAFILIGLFTMFVIEARRTARTPAWKAFQRRQALREFSDHVVWVERRIGEELLPVMQRLSVAIADACAAFDKFGTALRAGADDE